MKKKKQKIKYRIVKIEFANVLDVEPKFCVEYCRPWMLRWRSLPISFSDFSGAAYFIRRMQKHTGPRIVAKQSFTYVLN